MHHLHLEVWSRRNSPIHRLDVRIKLVCLLTALVEVVHWEWLSPARALFYFSISLTVTGLARLPVVPLLKRTLLVLPFAVIFAGMTWLAGSEAKALSILLKSYICGFLVLLLVATTPLPVLLFGLKWFRVPAFFLLVIHLIYRYLFLFIEQFQHMRLAALARGGFQFRPNAPLQGVTAAAAAVATLFLRAYERSERIYMAMLARLYRPGSEFYLLTVPRVHSSDFLKAAVWLGSLILTRWISLGGRL